MVETFNRMIRNAKAALVLRRSCVGRDIDMANAMFWTRRALSLANAMRCRKRQALCLKILNWLRADMRRAAA